MSALNVFRTAEAVHIYSDTAVFDLSKGLAVGGFGSKVYPLPRQNAVMASTGQNWLAPVLAQSIGFDGVDTFDGLVGKLSNIVRDTLARDAQQAGALKPGRFEVVVAGVSESTGEPAAWLMRNYDHGELKAFQVYPLNKLLWPEVPHEEYDETTGLRALQRQRETEASPHGSNVMRAHIVGGDAVHVIVSKAGVTYKRIWRWGDQIGQPIRPKLNPAIG